MYNLNLDKINTTASSAQAASSAAPLGNSIDAEERIGSRHLSAMYYFIHALAQVLMMCTVPVLKWYLESRAKRTNREAVDARKAPRASADTITTQVSLGNTGAEGSSIEMSLFRRAWAYPCFDISVYWPTWPEVGELSSCLVVRIFVLSECALWAYVAAAVYMVLFGGLPDMPGMSTANNWLISIILVSAVRSTVFSIVHSRLQTSIRKAEYAMESKDKQSQTLAEQLARISIWNMNLRRQVVEGSRRSNDRSLQDFHVIRSLSEEREAAFRRMWTILHENEQLRQLVSEKQTELEENLVVTQESILSFERYKALIEKHEARSISRLEEEIDDQRLAHFEALAQLNRDHQINLTEQRTMLRSRHWKAMKEMCKRLDFAQDKSARLEKVAAQAEVDLARLQEGTALSTRSLYCRVTQLTRELQTERSEHYSKLEADTKRAAQASLAIEAMESELRALVEKNEHLRDMNEWDYIDAVNFQG